MAEFLKNRKGSSLLPKLKKSAMQSSPAGSIAYKADTTFLNNEMVIPVNQNFTSATTSEELPEEFLLYSVLPQTRLRTRLRHYV